MKSIVVAISLLAVSPLPLAGEGAARHDWIFLDGLVRLDGPGGPAGAHATWLLLPAGHGLEGSFEDGTLLLKSFPSVTTILQQAVDGLPWGSDCWNDVPSTWSWESTYPVAKRKRVKPGVGVSDNVTTDDPVYGENMASKGECVYEEFQEPIRYFQFYTQGNAYGAVNVRDARGAFGVLCEGMGHATGAGAQAWWRIFDDVGVSPEAGPRDLAEQALREDADVCRVYYEEGGVYPSQYTHWTASVANGHRDAGSFTWAGFSGELNPPKDDASQEGGPPGP